MEKIVFIIAVIIYAIMTICVTVKVMVELSKKTENIVQWYYTILVLVLVAITLPAATFHSSNIQQMEEERKELSNLRE